MAQKGKEPLGTSGEASPRRHLNLLERQVGVLEVDELGNISTGIPLGEVPGTQFCCVKGKIE